jgi:hypothetical protein
MSLYESSDIANNKVEISNYIDDYVIVEQPDEIRDDDRSRECGRGSGIGSFDDASYDYCYDVCPNGEDDDDENSVASLESEAAHKDNFFLSVPSGLMKDLDDAHRAAKLACSSCEGGGRGEDSSLKDDREDLQKATKPVENKASTDELALEIITTMTPRTKTQTKVATAAAAAANLSRASNKKRRKQLKLVKKAQAAASAAQTLSARAAANSKANKGKKVAASPTSSSLTSRKVANLAVACALETMASYRKEVLCSSVS